MPPDYLLQCSKYRLHWRNHPVNCIHGAAQQFAAWTIPNSIQPEPSMLNNEQFAAAQKSNVAAILGLTAKAFEGVEQLTALNMQVFKTGIDKASEASIAALSVKDPQSLIALQTGGFQPAAESSFLRSYEEPVEIPRSFGSKVLPWAGWAIAAGLAVTAGNFYRDREGLKSTIASEAGKMARLTEEASAARQVLDTMNDSTATRVTLQMPKTAPVPQGRTTYVADRGSLIFIASNMQPLTPHKTYELWLIPADGRDPIPAGTFQPDARGNASVIMPNLPKGVPAKAFGITIEDESGATTPTMPIIMAGAAAGV